MVVVSCGFWPGSELELWLEYCMRRNRAMKPAKFFAPKRKPVARKRRSRLDGEKSRQESGRIAGARFLITRRSSSAPHMKPAGRHITRRRRLVPNSPKISKAAKAARESQQWMTIF